MRADGGGIKGGRDYGPSTWCSLELHSDGSGTYAVRLPDLARRSQSDPDNPPLAIIDDESIAGALLVGLASLGRHAWESGSGGLANLRARIWPIDNEHPAALGHTRRLGTDAYGSAVAKAPIGVVSAPLDHLHPSGADLVTVSALLLRDLHRASVSRKSVVGPRRSYSG